MLQCRLILPSCPPFAPPDAPLYPEQATLRPSGGEMLPCKLLPQPSLRASARHTTRLPTRVCVHIYIYIYIYVHACARVIRTSTRRLCYDRACTCSTPVPVLAAEYANHASLGQCSFSEGDSGQRALHSMLLGTQTAV